MGDGALQTFYITVFQQGKCGCDDDAHSIHRQYSVPELSGKIQHPLQQNFPDGTEKEPHKRYSFRRIEYCFMCDGAFDFCSHLSHSVCIGLAVPVDIASSSTAWLLIQGLVSGYGEDGTKDVLKGIYKNAGDHIEESGSGPLKLVRAGEVAIGFGLRQQAVADKASGLPINYVDPSEGNFTLTESAAVVDKGDKSNPKAMEMAECIIKNGRAKLLGILDQFAEVKSYVLETMEELRKRGIEIGSTTVYTDKMMAIVVPKAKENGYVPDAWFSPDAVGHVGRPFPYMIFQNMQTLHIQSVSSVMKVGDTISDIKEGKNAGADEVIRNMGELVGLL